MNLIAALDSFDLLCLNGAAAFVDSKLDVLDERARHSPDPDSDGTFDRGEYLAGFGFMACQMYITEAISMSRLSREDALNVGPRHVCGHTIAALVNATANYWKHSPEWRASMSRRAEATAGLIEDLGVDVGSSYVVVNALAQLVQPRKHRIRYVIPFLSQWRAALQPGDA